ncbi:MAG: FkbM family methyltransferase [Leptolyngbya sp. UWPOB_LEPTO1]|uniref:FkbM family methyltransferase n=1 Tax=Leptolyngbya sp. UWPOB_LEPTO1 TaxID=2815653 RepID=UPI001AC630BD|nr:FkbM family methyltransferase [Leptolyngbya sp. UWPOB_LEPTO1]MBN8560372.1 FkbM family methyltransferase [Leptolyngbya sp. UWPOB_LEPTO1]
MLPPNFRRSGNTSLFVFRENYEPELDYLYQTVTEGDVFIDAGANCGIYTLLASCLVGNSGLVLSFEPGVESFNTIQQNLKLNHLSNVRLFKTALSDHTGTAHLYHIDNAPSSYSLGSGTDPAVESETVDVTTLDAILTAQGIETVDFIKMDVEGAEELVLKGAYSTIEKMRPKILFEVGLETCERLNLASDGAFNFLNQLDYTFFKIKHTGELVEIASPQGIRGNILAISKSS